MELGGWRGLGAPDSPAEPLLQPCQALLPIEVTRCPSRTQPPPAQQLRSRPQAQMSKSPLSCVSYRAEHKTTRARSLRLVGRTAREPVLGCLGGPEGRPARGARSGSSVRPGQGSGPEVSRASGPAPPLLCTVGLC